MYNYKAVITEIEYFLPPTIEGYEDLKKDNPDWNTHEIEKKTGILKRYIAKEMNVIEMAEQAVQKLIEKVDSPTDVDFLILVTQSAPLALPSSSCILHQRLGLKKECFVYDVNLGCSGFVYALFQGSCFIQSGYASKGIIICSEKYSRYIGKNNRTCRPIFSDAASATLIEKKQSKFGIGPFQLGTDGNGYGDLIVKPNDGSTNTTFGELYMNGSKVFMFTMNMVPKCINELLTKIGLKIDNIDYFVFHQASKLVIDNLVRHLGIPFEKAIINYPMIGNTVSASIPIALKQADSENKFKLGDKIILVGFGVGYSWGACYLEWSEK